MQRLDTATLKPVASQVVGDSEGSLRFLRDAVVDVRGNRTVLLVAPTGMARRFTLPGLQEWPLGTKRPDDGSDGPASVDEIL